MQIRSAFLHNIFVICKAWEELRNISKDGTEGIAKMSILLILAPNFFSVETS